MKAVKLTISLWIALAALCSSCAVLIGTSRDVLSEVQNGMSKQEVTNLLGKPAYRRFDQGGEEWEYTKELAGNARTTIILVQFENDRVVAMDSFAAPYAPTSPTPPVVPVYPQDKPINRPPSSYGRMAEADFLDFFRKVKSKPFKDDKMDLIQVGASGNRFTCNQCARMMSLFSFDSERMEVLKVFAPLLTDKMNYDTILDELDSLFKKDDAKRVLRVP